MKSTFAGSLFVLTVSAVLSAPAAADSIGTVYDMDRMLFEPHPLANEYGTRWQPPPAPGMPVPPTSTVPTPAAPGAPSPIASPFPAPPPEPPPTTFPPPPPPPISTTAPPAPAPKPAPAGRPVVPEAAATAEAPPLLVMSPRLSIDLGGIDLEPEAADPEKSRTGGNGRGPAEGGRK